jgi:predicted nucleic acid-binding protein
MVPGPFLFDTSAESWFARTADPQALDWLRRYLSRHQVRISAVTVLNGLGRVWPLDAAAALVAGEIMALLPSPPTPPRRSHRLAESHQERLARWRFDGLIVATALVAGMPLVHNNAPGFEASRV